MIYMPIGRSLAATQFIRDSDITDGEKKRLNSAFKLVRIHIRRQTQPPLMLAAFSLKCVSPFHNAIPIIPWL